jgi:hypothetical protein
MCVRVFEWLRKRTTTGKEHLFNQSTRVRNVTQTVPACLWGLRPSNCTRSNEIKSKSNEIGERIAAITYHESARLCNMTQSSASTAFPTWYYVVHIPRPRRVRPCGKDLARQSASGDPHWNITTD